MIGVFDSGVGGLTVMKEIIRILPQYKLVYFGDTARIPYGTKSKETVVRFALQDAEFLISKGATILVVACNTMSTQAIDELRSEFDVPLFEVVTGTVNQAVELAKKVPVKHQKIGVIGTQGTIRSGLHERLIREQLPHAQIFSKACQLFVPLVEEGWHKKPETKRIIRTYLRQMKREHIRILILACTHFPILARAIQEVMGPQVRLVDAAQELAKQLKSFLDTHKEVEKKLAKGENEYYASDVPNNFDRFAKMLFGKGIRVKKVEVG